MKFRKLFYVIVFSLSLVSKIYDPFTLLNIFFKLINTPYIAVLLTISTILYQLLILIALYFNWKYCEHLILSFFSFSFIYSLYGFFYFKGIDCGCFSGILQLEHGYKLLLRNLLFLAIPIFGVLTNIKNE